MSKFALIHIESGAVVQWQDDALYGYPDAPEGHKRQPLPDEFEFPAAPTWLRDGEFTAQAPDPAPVPPMIPISVTRAQAKLALLDAGLLDDVETAIEAMESDDRRRAQIEWNERERFERQSPFLQQMAGLVGLDDAALDALFVDAASR